MLLFLVREFMGWILLFAGLFGFWMTLGLVSNRQVVEGSIVGLIGISVFRAGIQLIRVSTAARIVLLADAQRKLDVQK